MLNSLKDRTSWAERYSTELLDPHQIDGNVQSGEGSELLRAFVRLICFKCLVFT